MSYVRRYLETFNVLSEDQYAEIAPYDNSILVLEKGEYFLKYGEIANQMSLIIEGIMANNYLVDGEEKINYFLTKNEVAANPESFDFRTPSKVCIRAITPCRLVTVDHATYWRMVDDIPWWGQLTRTIGSVVLTNRLQERAELMVLSPTERYETFVRDNPGILQQAPLGLIASYLGMQLPSLSRIRRKQCSKK